MYAGTKIGALESAPLRTFEPLKARREPRREPYEALCEAVVYAISLAILAAGAAVVHNLWIHISMIV